MDAAASPVTYRTRRWRRDEYERLIARGVFASEEPLELIGGELVVRDPQSDSHALAVAPLTAAWPQRGAPKRRVSAGRTG